MRCTDSQAIEKGQKVTAKRNEFRSYRSIDNVVFVAFFAANSHLNLTLHMIESRPI